MQSEKRAKENQMCRDIVKDIMTIGLSQRQITFLIHLLAMELEDFEMSRELAEYIKQAKPDVFISSTPGEET